MKKKILQIIDVHGWAIDRLASAIVRHNPQFEWRQIYLHPRDLDANKIDLAQTAEAIAWCDAIDIQYWRLFPLLKDKIPQMLEKPIMLTHHNEENLLHCDWTGVKTIVAKTRHSENKLHEAGYKNVIFIPNSYDPEMFKWNPDWPPQEKSVGYVGRVVDWKGLKGVARAAKELGVPLRVMGKGNDQEYYNSIPEADRDNIDWSFFEMPDDGIWEFYRNISVYVCNADPFHEVGPLPLIEAMGSGVPCVSTPCGIAKDIGKPRENMMIVPFGDYECLRDSIREILESPALGNGLRQKGWNTIRAFTDASMARSYAEAFYQLLAEDEKAKLVSVIIPATYERFAQVQEILKSLEEQEYKNIEAIICWDEEHANQGEISLTARFPFREVITGVKGYNLAMARNLGVIEACGEYLLLCDSRFKPELGSITAFVKRFDDFKEDDKVWFFGNKMVKGIPADKGTFIENWSMIRRQNLINAGMFNERISEYGGMSQELRSRFLSQGFELVYCPEIYAEEILSSSSRSEERRMSMIRMKELLRKLNFDK
jgi:glycosyltransferase involved in cell wall biosynthesis